MVKVRRRVEGVEELVKSRRVSMMYELGCDSVTVAVAKLSLCSIGRGVSEYGRSVTVNKLVFGGGPIGQNEVQLQDIQTTCCTL